jgi:hypothetical protein
VQHGRTRNGKQADREKRRDSDEIEKSKTVQAQQEIAGGRGLKEVKPLLNP